MGTTQLAVCNTALELIKSQDLLTGGNFPTFIGSPAIATAANVLYGPVRDLLLREINPEFSRITIAGTTVPLGAASVIAPWAYEYFYPADGLRIRQVRPPMSGAGALPDPNDPIPIRAAVAYDPNAQIFSSAGNVVSTGAKVVLTNQQNALIVYSSNVPPESTWDPDFAEAMARRLANPFAMAIAGRPDYARELLETAERYAGLAAENGDL